MTREDELLHKMAQGDPGAAEELVELFYPDILRYCLWHMPDRSLAEDAAQETFLKLIRHFDRYTHQGRLKAFLYRIALNTCIDLQRKNSRTDISLEESAMELPCPEPAFDDIHSDMVLRQLVSSLPADQQEIVLLRFGQDLTLREISKVVNLPLRTVQSRLRAALKKLKAEISASKEKHISVEKNPASEEKISASKKKNKSRKGGLL